MERQITFNHKGHKDKLHLTTKDTKFYIEFIEDDSQRAQR